MVEVVFVDQGHHLGCHSLQIGLENTGNTSCRFQNAHTAKSLNPCSLRLTVLI